MRTHEQWTPLRSHTHPLRKELGFLQNEKRASSEERMAIEDFRGLFNGEAVTKEMFEEYQLVNAVYANVASRIVQRED